MRNKYLIACLLVFGFTPNSYAANNPPCIKYVVFDFGGVIANVSRAQLVDFLMNTFPISLEESHMVLGKWREALLSGAEEIKFWQDYAASVNVILPNDWLAQFEEVQMNALQPIPETIAAIRGLKEQGYPTAMLSNVTSQHAAVIRRLGYYEWFNPVLLSYAIGVQKPNPEAYRLLLAQLPVKPEEVLFVDDQNRNVVAARQLGINAIHLTHPEWLNAQFQEYGIYLNTCSMAP